MRTVTLPNDGRTLRVGVFHTKYDDWAWGFDLNGHLVKHRKTVVRVSDPDGLLDVSAEAACSNNDNFCKLEGRKRAATRLLRKLVGLSKEDKRAIFFNICPEFTPPALTNKAIKQACKALDKAME